jgi:transcriptional antiterminator NusG
VIDERDSTADHATPHGDPGDSSPEGESAAAPSNTPPSEAPPSEVSTPELKPAVADAAGEGMVAAEVAPTAAEAAGEPVTGGLPAPEVPPQVATIAARTSITSGTPLPQRAVEAAEDEPADAEPVAEPVAEASDAPAPDDSSEPAASPAKRNGRKSAPPEQPAEAAESVEKNWYILKVQSNREETIADGLRRRAAIAGLGDHFGEVIVPTEMVTEFKGGKKKVVKRKLYPGYIVVHMHINEDTWFLVRDTPGIGDFTGSGGKPIPMQAHEISRLITKQEETAEEAPKLKISFKPGDRVKINEGTFENFEGDVDSIDQTNGRVTVMINIFGRSTPVELEYWQIESV